MMVRTLWYGHPGHHIQTVNCYEDVDLMVPLYTATQLYSINELQGAFAMLVGMVNALPVGDACDRYNRK